MESGVETGSVVSVHYDPLLFKLIARGRDRDEALARMRAAIAATRSRACGPRCPSSRGCWSIPTSGAALLHTQMVDQGAFR